MESGGLSLKWLEEEGCPAVGESQERLHDWRGYPEDSGFVRATHRLEGNSSMLLVDERSRKRTHTEQARDTGHVHFDIQNAF